MNHVEYMARAIQLAKRGLYSVHPNPPVGCVLVKNGDIVGEGYHIRAGQGHAEANALTAAGDEANGAIAYVTLEPCSFKGRTPSCAEALIAAGVSELVVAMRDPDPRNAGKGLQKIKEAGINVIEGVLEASAHDVVKGQVSRYIQGKPYIRLKLAMTLDGKTALPNGDSQWITGEAARADVQKLRAKSGAIVTGVQTVIDDNPRMNVRAESLDAIHADVAADIERPVYVLDSSLRIPRDAGILQRADTVIVTGVMDETVIGKAQVVTLATERVENRIDLYALMTLLVERQHNEVLFECGATLGGAALAAGVVDELIVYIAPKLMGSHGQSLLNLPEIGRMADLSQLAIQDIRQIGGDIRVTATPLPRDVSGRN